MAEVTSVFKDTGRGHGGSARPLLLKTRANGEWAEGRGLSQPAVTLV